MHEKQKEIGSLASESYIDINEHLDFLFKLVVKEGGKSETSAH
jgi:hypothetical protein